MRRDFLRAAGALLLFAVSTGALAQTPLLPALTATPASGGGTTYTLSIQTLLLITALGSALQPDAPDLQVGEFILANISQRLAASLREEIEQRGKVKDKDAEAAKSEIVNVIRTLESAGELTFIASDEE